MLNCIFIGISLMLVLAYRLNRISMRHTFGVMTVVAQLFTCNEMLLCALFRSEYNIMLIVGNMVLLVANVMFSLIGQLRKVPYILGGIGMITYMACVVITDNSILKNFATLYMVMS